MGAIITGELTAREINENLDAAVALSTRPEKSREEEFCEAINELIKAYIRASTGREPTSTSLEIDWAKAELLRVVKNGTDKDENL
jgi:hypothetical protein